MAQLTEYEKVQLVFIREWESLKPSAVNRSLNIFNNVVRNIVGYSFLNSYLKESLEKFCDDKELENNREDILQILEKEGNKEIKHLDLESRDQLAQKIISSNEANNIGIIPPMVEIMPFILPDIRFLYSAINKIALCYGYDCISIEDKMYSNFILASVCSNNMNEKLTSLSGIKYISLLSAKDSKKDVMHTKLLHDFNKTFVSQLRKNLIKRGLFSSTIFEAKLELRKLYIEVSEGALRMYQKRWLFDNNKIGL